MRNNNQLQNRSYAKYARKPPPIQQDYNLFGLHNFKRKSIINCTTTQQTFQLAR